MDTGEATMKVVKTEKLPSKVIYNSKLESYRHLFAMVVYVAARDAADIIESSSFSRLRGLRRLTRRDAASFFIDGRYKWFADFLDLCPDVLPESWAVMREALDFPAEVEGQTFGDWLNRRHMLQMKRIDEG
jgi:hypothetical protein